MKGNLEDDQHLLSGILKQISQSKACLIVGPHTNSNNHLSCLSSRSTTTGTWETWSFTFSRPETWRRETTMATRTLSSRSTFCPGEGELMRATPVMSPPCLPCAFVCVSLSWVHSPCLFLDDCTLCNYYTYCLGLLFLESDTVVFYCIFRGNCNEIPCWLFN